MEERASAASGTVSVAKVSERGRKRKFTRDNRTQQKIARYSAPEKAFTLRPCQHNSNKTRVLCGEIKQDDVDRFRENFFRVPQKARQDCIVACLIETSPVKRRRPRRVVNTDKNKHSQHKFDVHYYLPSVDNKRVAVCKKMFLSVTGMGRTRLKNIVDKVDAGMSVTDEKRGGDRRSHLTIIKKEYIRDFIKTLRGTDAHYSRTKAKRIYLGAELNIRRLHRMCVDQSGENLNVSYTMFRRIFLNEFNIGFKSPATETCPYCNCLNVKLSNASHTSLRKAQLMGAKRIHKQRARAFYQHLTKSVEDSINLCFDLQQVQPLPKSPAYYSSRLGFYNLCITDLQERIPQFYVWTEDQAGKGGSEISSALLCHLKSMKFENKTILRLFSDGCVAQNKTDDVLRTLIHFCETSVTSIREIRLHFPVRGHSYLPTDRVFWTVEKILRQFPIVLFKEDYIDCYKAVGIVKVLGQDWELFDTKSLQFWYRNLPNISDVKRIILKVMTAKDGTKNVLVKGLKCYRVESEDEKFVSLKKTRSRDMCEVKLNKMPLTCFISDDKKKDVEHLLDVMFGKDWRRDERFRWYKEVLSSKNVAPQLRADESIFCDCLETDGSQMHI